MTGRVQPSPALRAALVEVYRSHSALAELCERMVDLDEGLHGVALPPREDGAAHDRHPAGHRRQPGAEYLMATLNQPLFPDLWAIRTEL